MKPKAALRHFLALAGSSLLAISSASAADLFWDQNGDATTATGGTGTWNTSSTWRSGSSTGTLGDWTDGNVAVFGGTAGIVTLSAPVSATGLTFSTTGYTITGSTLTLTGTPVINAGVTATTISSSISGSNGFEKTGSGVLLLNGTNDYTGGTIITGGRLNVATDAALGNSTGGITLNGGMLAPNNTTNATRSGGVNLTTSRDIIVGASGGSIFVSKNNNISTTGALSGSGTLTFVDPGGSGGNPLYNFSSSTNTFTGSMSLFAFADVRVGSLGDTAGNNIVFTGAGSFSLNSSGVTAGLTFNNRAIELSNAGATVSNNNTTHAITIGSNLVATGAAAKTLTLSAVAGPNNLFGGNITDGTGGGTVAITKSGAGTWILTGDNSYSGGTALTTGTLQIAKTQAMPATGTFAVATGGTLAVNVGGSGEFSDATSGTGSLGGLLAGTGGKGGAVTYTGTVTLGIDTTNASGGNFTYAGDIATVGTTFNLRKIGTNTLTLSGNNSFNGSLTVAQGTVSINTINNASSAGVLGNSANAVVLGSSGNTGTLLYTGATASSTKTFTAATSGTGAFNIQEAGTNLTLSGVIGGSGNITKAGAGILTLGVANGYTGATDVNGGELRWGISNAIAAGALNINDGGTVNMDTFTDSVGAVTIAKGGTISGTTGTLTPAGNALVSNNGGTISLGASSSGAIVASNVTYNDTIAGSTTLNIERLTIGNLTLNVARGDDASGIDVNINILRNSANAGRTIVKNGSGVAQLSGSIQSESFGLGDGATTINDGTLIFNKSAEVTATGSGLITIGDDIGSANSAVLQFRTSNNQIGNNAITIKSDGLFDLNGRSETTSGAVINNGSIATGAGTLTLAGTTATALTMGGTGSINGNITMSGANNATGITATGDTTIAGVLALGTSNNRSIAVTNSNDKLTISAQLTGGTGRTLTKSGAGTLTLSSDNTGFAAGISVTNGTLLINNTTGTGTGSGTITVATGATLGGTGAISGAVNVTGQLSPGASIETLATGTLSMANSSTLVHELNSSVADEVGSDLLKVTGNLNLTGTVGLTLDDLALVDAAFQVNDVFSLINYTGTWNNGLFTFGGNELSDEEVFAFGLNTWKISYNDPTGGLNYPLEYAGGSDSFVNITAMTAIPEPGVALLGSLGLMLMFRRRR